MELSEAGKKFMDEKLDRIKARLTALEIAAGFELPPREKVEYKGGDPSQGPE